MSFISQCTSDVIVRAAKALKDGHLVAFPTETVYGLGADATNSEAVARIYSTKGRPADHPLIVHISSMQMMDKWAIDIPEYAIKLAREFWPGPMTLVLKRSELAKDFITGNQDTVGIRVPDQPVALALLSEFEKLGGMGVAAPSANRFGAVSPTTAEAVEDELSDYLGEQDLILDGGQCEVGVESTIIDCTNVLPWILRPGAITSIMVSEVSNSSLSGAENLVVRVSGTFESHYSPKARVVIGREAKSGEGLIAMSQIMTSKGVIRLAAPQTIDEFAYSLYAALRRADQLKLAIVVVVIPEGDGLATAIRDRLTKASF